MKSYYHHANLKGTNQVFLQEKKVEGLKRRFQGVHIDCGTLPLCSQGQVGSRRTAWIPPLYPLRRGRYQNETSLLERFNPFYNYFLKRNSTVARSNPISKNNYK